MARHIVWEQEKKNIGGPQWLLRGLLACATYLLLAKGMMGLAGHLFGFQAVGGSMKYGCLLFLSTLGIGLWNERAACLERKKLHLLGNVLLLVGLALVLWFVYGSLVEELKEGFEALGNAYMARWNAHTGKYIPTGMGSVSAMRTAVEFLLLIVVPLLQVLGSMAGKRKLTLALPVIIVCMGLLAVCTPQWKDIVFLFISGVLFFCLDSYDKINGKLLLAIIIGVFLVLRVAGCFQENAEKLVISWNGEWFFMQKNLEESIRNGKLISWISPKDRVDNSTPIYKEEQVIELSMSEKTQANVYLKGYHCKDYEEGIWTKDDTAFQAACEEYGIGEEKASRQLLEIQHESEHITSNEQIIYELGYTGIRDKYLYFPYGTGWAEEPEEYFFTGDSVVKKRKNLKEAKALSWKEFRYLDEWPLLNINVDNQDMKIVSVFASGYSANKLSYEERKLSDWYGEFVFENYLRVPQDMDTIKEQAKQIQNTMEYKGNIVFLEKLSTTVETRNTARLQIAYLVSSWLKKDNRYDLELDRLPRGEDAIEYFLSTSKEGYCVHFASAGTLILRELGIPARYVTGYVVKPETVTYQEGDYKASVLDSDAHAWVEVYLENYGWVPVEMTPGYKDARSQAAEPTNVLQQVDSPSEPSVDEVPEETEATPEQQDKQETESEEQMPLEEDGGVGREENTEGSKGPKDSETGPKRIVGRLLIGSLLVFLMSLTGFVVYRHRVDNRSRATRRLNAYIRRGENKKAIKWINDTIYQMLVDRERRYAQVRDGEYLAALKREFPELEEASWDAYFDIVRRVVYSREEVSSEEARECFVLYKRVQENSKKR